LAASVKLSRYQKHPRGPKKKPPERAPYENGKHVSIANTLAIETTMLKGLAYVAQELREFATMARGVARLAPLYGFADKLPKDLLDRVRDREGAFRQGAIRVPLVETPPARTP
jgi:hypothetical protein